MSTAPPRYYGKFRGTVKNNIDPLLQGRVQVAVPFPLGEGTLAWAMPCVPYAGDGVGLFLVPPVGASVWIEFEAGDLDRPILGGCFWATASQVPASPAVPEMKVFKTGTLTLELSELPGAGGLTIKVASPAVLMPIAIALTSSGIELKVGASKIVLSGTSVSVNDGALEVM